MINSIKSILKKVPFLCIVLTFASRMSLGYFEYSAIKRRYGADCKICACAFDGTGDYYLCGMYLQFWLAKNNASKYIFLNSGGSAAKVAELFEVYNGHLHKKQPTRINRMKHFLCDKSFDFHYFHYASDQNSIAQMKARSPLFGYKGLEMLDLYLYCGFELPRGTIPCLPVFSEES